LLERLAIALRRSLISPAVPAAPHRAARFAFRLQRCLQRSATVSHAMSGNEREILRGGNNLPAWRKLVRFVLVGRTPDPEVLGF
jgi:hypothetical protein